MAQRKAKNFFYNRTN